MAGFTPINPVSVSSGAEIIRVISGENSKTLSFSVKNFLMFDFTFENIQSYIQFTSKQYSIKINQFLI